MLERTLTGFKKQEGKGSDYWSVTTPIPFVTDLIKWYLSDLLKYASMLHKIDYWTIIYWHEMKRYSLFFMFNLVDLSPVPAKAVAELRWLLAAESNLIIWRKKY